MRLDNVGIAVRDVAAARKFFADQVGLDLDGDDDSLTVQAGGASFYVFRAGDSEQDVDAGAGAAAGVEMQAWVPDPDLLASRPGYDHLSFAVEDVDVAYELLLGRGVRFLAPPRSREDWGLRVAPFVDPDGNLYFLIRPL